MQDKHKYRVQVYLGKELYEKLEELSKFMGIPVATVAKLLLKTGFELSSAIERKMELNISGKDK